MTNRKKTTLILAPTRKEGERLARQLGVPLMNVVSPKSIDWFRGASFTKLVVTGDVTLTPSQAHTLLPAFMEGTNHEYNLAKSTLASCVGASLP